MDFIKTGKKYGSDKAHREVGRCLPLLVEHASNLQTQGIDASFAARLEAHDQALTTGDQQVAEAKQVQEKETDTVQALLSESVSQVGLAWSFSFKAFGETSPATLESFPPRGTLSTGVDEAVRGLNDTAAFVRTHAAALVAVDAPADLAARLTRHAEDILAASKRQSAAEQAVTTRSQAVYQTRGQIYNLCRMVYDAGRIAFRKQESIRKLFRFEYMKRPSSSGVEGESAGTEGGESGGTEGGGESARRGTAKRRSRRKAGAVAPPASTPPSASAEASSAGESG